MLSILLKGRAGKSTFHPAVSHQANSPADGSRGSFRLVSSWQFSICSLTLCFWKEIQSDVWRLSILTCLLPVELKENTIYFSWERRKKKRIVFNLLFMLTFPINENRKMVSFQILIIFFITGFSALKPNIFQNLIFNQEIQFLWKILGVGIVSIFICNEGPFSVWIWVQTTKYPYFNECLCFGDLWNFILFSYPAK